MSKPTQPHLENASAGTLVQIYVFYGKNEHDLKNILSKISLFVKKSFQFF